MRYFEEYHDFFCPVLLVFIASHNPRSLCSGDTSDICDILRPQRDNSTCIAFLKKEILTGEL